VWKILRDESEKDREKDTEKNLIVVEDKNLCRVIIIQDKKKD
jgi:hypothetical protein